MRLIVCGLGHNGLFGRGIRKQLGLGGGYGIQYISSVYVSPLWGAYSGLLIAYSTRVFGIFATIVYIKEAEKRESGLRELELNPEFNLLSIQVDSKEVKGTT